MLLSESNSISIDDFIDLLISLETFKCDNPSVLEIIDQKAAEFLKSDLISDEELIKMINVINFYGCQNASLFNLALQRLLRIEISKIRDLSDICELLITMTENSSLKVDELIHNVEEGILAIPSFYNINNMFKPFHCLMYLNRASNRFKLAPLNIILKKEITQVSPYFLAHYTFIYTMLNEMRLLKASAKYFSRFFTRKIIEFDKYPSRSKIYGLKSSDFKYFSKDFTAISAVQMIWVLSIIKEEKKHLLDDQLVDILLKIRVDPDFQPSGNNRK